MRLEDFGLRLSYEAVSLIIEFIYKGEVNIASNQLITMANAAHGLGIDGLQEFLPDTLCTTRHSPSSPEKDSHCNTTEHGRETRRCSKKMPDDSNVTSMQENGPNLGKRVATTNTQRSMEEECNDIVVLNCDDDQDHHINNTNNIPAVSPCRSKIKESSSSHINDSDQGNINGAKGGKENNPTTAPLLRVSKELPNSSVQIPSPRSTQTAHSTLTDDDSDPIESSSVLPKSNSSHQKNSEGSKFLDAAHFLGTMKCSDRSSSNSASNVSRSDVSNLTSEVQHCSIGSTVPFSKDLSPSSATAPLLPCSTSSQAGPSSDQTVHVSSDTTPNQSQGLSEVAEIHSQGRSTINTAPDSIIQRQANKATTMGSLSIFNPTTSQMSPRRNEIEENTMATSSLHNQNGYLPVTTSSEGCNNSTPLQTNSQNYQIVLSAGMQSAPSYIGSDSLKNNRQHSTQPINASLNMNSKISTIIPSATSNSITTQTLSDARTVSTGGKLKGKLRVINQVGTLVGNTTPNIQASSNSLMNFNGFVEDGRNHNASYNQTQQFFDTLLQVGGVQSEANIHFRPSNQMDNIVIATANSSDIYHADNPHILGQQAEYGNASSSDFNIGNEEVTIIEEIAIANPAEHVPFNMVNSSGYQYQQPIHNELNSFQTAPFPNDVSAVYHHSTQNQVLHSQQQNHRTQDHPPPPPLWMPPCPPPPLAAAPQQTFSVVAAHAAAQAVVAHQQGHYEELSMLDSNTPGNGNVDHSSNRLLEPLNNHEAESTAIDSRYPSQSASSSLISEEFTPSRKRNGLFQKESKSKKEEFEEVQEYIEVDDEEGRRALNNALNGVVVRTEPPDLDEVSWSIPHSPAMSLENHTPSEQPPHNSDSNSGSSQFPTTNWSWTTPAEDSIVDWSTRLAQMTGNTQSQSNLDSSSNGAVGSQFPPNWHTLAVSTGAPSSESLATPCSTISESPPLVVFSDSISVPHSSHIQSTANTTIDQDGPRHIRHPSSELVSLLLSKGSESSNSAMQSTSANISKDSKASGLPLLAEVAQVAAAVSVKSEMIYNKSQKKRIKSSSTNHLDNSDGAQCVSNHNKSPKKSQRGELEVRKDLTIHPANMLRNSADEINVFEADIPSSSSSLLEVAGGNVITSVYNNIPNIEQPIVAVRSNFRPRQRRKHCIECSMTFSSTMRLKQHIRHAHRREEVFSCPNCDEQNIKGKENLKLHMYKNHGVGEIFRCEDCSFETSAKMTFTRHTLNMHPNDPNENNDDPSDMSEVGSFGTGKSQRPILPCNGSPDATDSTLGMVSTSQTKLSVSRSQRFNCKFCARGFKSKAGLKLHMQQHTNEAMHCCMVCTFRTPQQQNLLKHLATKHKKDLNGEDLKANNECKMCDFKCVAEYQLKAHVLRKHTARSEMKYQCSECSYASVEKSALEKHIRFRHTKVSFFKL